MFIHFFSILVKASERFKFIHILYNSNESKISIFSFLIYLFIYLEPPCCTERLAVVESTKALKLGSRDGKKQGLQGLIPAG